MDWLRAFTILVSALATVTANAEAAKVPPAIGQSWPVIIRKLKAQGIEKVGALDLGKFTTAAKDVKWIANPGLPPEELTGNRKSAYYLTTSKTVFISKNLSKQASSSLSHLELHEAMGALGFSDQNYALSTSLHLLSEMPSTAERNKMADVLGKTVFRKSNIMAEANGGSSVGGGGDLNALFIKNRILKDIIDGPGVVTSDFLAVYPTIAFEPIYKKGVDDVVIDYNYRSEREAARIGLLPGVPVRKGGQELITIFVPIHRWQSSSPNERRAVADEIEDRIFAIFPAFADFDKILLTPTGCDSSIRVEFPRVSDANVQTIQSYRASILRGCETISSAMRIQYPALPLGAAPEDVSKLPFDCIWKVGESRGGMRLIATKGKSIMMSTRGALDDGQTFMPSVTVAEDGTIVRLMIFSGPSEKSHIQKLAVDHKIKAEFKTTIEGYPARLTCERKKIDR